MLIFAKIASTVAVRTKEKCKILSDAFIRDWDQKIDSSSEITAIQGYEQGLRYSSKAGTERVERRHLIATVAVDIWARIKASFR